MKKPSQRRRDTNRSQGATLKAQLKERGVIMGRVVDLKVDSEGWVGLIIQPARTGDVESRITIWFAKTPAGNNGPGWPVIAKENV